MEWIIFILGYPLSFFLLKHALYLDRTYKYWDQESNNRYDSWYEYYEGREKIYKIIFLIPGANFVGSIIAWIVNFICMSYEVVSDKISDLFDNWDPFNKKPDPNKEKLKNMERDMGSRNKFTADEWPHDQQEKKKSFFNNFKIKF